MSEKKQEDYKKKKIFAPLIFGEKDDLSAMLVGTERYAIGRRTYFPSWFCEFVINNIHLITKKDKIVMMRDIDEAKYLGDECDANAWKNLYKHLENSLKKGEKTNEQ